MKSSSLPIIDISSLRSGTADKHKTADAIHSACQKFGFFYIVEHGVDLRLQKKLEFISRQFFELPLHEKMKMHMSNGGKAWRGYFPVGEELTSGKPDIKEGLYFGSELENSHPKVRAGVPLHGKNLFPSSLPEFSNILLRYLQQMEEVGHILMKGLALSLGLNGNYFNDRYTRDPLLLFRIFHYPAIEKKLSENISWGVGEHTDYGVLTILKQDEIGGLQIKSKSGWMEAPYIENSFVCNIGDMLDRMTQGYYRSTPHRVLNRSGKSRYSFPFFFDPNFDAEVNPIDLSQARDFVDDKSERWDGQSVHQVKGSYGDYLLGKIAKVFPNLKKEVDG